MDVAGAGQPRRSRPPAPRRPASILPPRTPTVAEVRESIVAQLVVEGHSEAGDLLGLLQGFGDIVLMPLVHGAPTCALVIVRPGKTPTTNQLTWIARADERGWSAAWADSEEEAVSTLRGWGYLR